MNINIENTIDLEKRWNHLITNGPKTPAVSENTNPLDCPPEWYDQERFMRAQKVYEKYYYRYFEQNIAITLKYPLIMTVTQSIQLGNMIGHTFLFFMPQIIIPFLSTGRISNVYKLFIRMKATNDHHMTWFKSDPFDKDSHSYKGFERLRKIFHLSAQKNMNKRYPQKGCVWVNQYDMAMTLFASVGCAVIRPKNFGLHSTTRQEFNEMIYFWKVFGYCIGVMDEFTVCLNDYESCVQYLEMCFERGYKKTLLEGNQLAQLGMQMAEGVFLGLNSVIPKFMFSFQGNMKYYLDAFNVEHSISLQTYPDKFCYHMMRMLMHIVLRWRIFHRISAIVYNYFLNSMTKKRKIENYCDRHYSHLCYDLKHFEDKHIIDDNFYVNEILN